MAGTTLRSSKTQITLAALTTGNPFRAGVGVSIDDGTPGGRGIFGNASRAWTLANAGSVVGGAGKRGTADPGGIGVDLLGHASHLTNSGTIAGGAGANDEPGGNGGAGGAGVMMAGAATLSNSGTIMAGAGGEGDDATTTKGNGGTGAVGVFMSGGHDILTNGAKGSITGGAGASGVAGGTGGSGVRLFGGAGIVSNSGIIQGGAGYEGYPFAGEATDISGAGALGLYMAGAANSLSNHGTIGGGSGASSFNHGANGGMGVNIAGSATIANSGAIHGGAGGYGGYHAVASYAGFGGNGGVGLQLTQGGTVTNHSGGAIMGGGGGDASIADSGGAGSGGNGGNGVNLSHGGTLENQSGASILGGRGGYAYDYGSGDKAIEAAGGIGVSFGGTADSTLINAGTIAGGSGAKAVQFGAGDDRLILDPGAVFTGGVDGGKGKNTLELAGHRIGAISGIGTSFTNFQTIEVDAGASWTDNKLVTSGEALSVDGVLTLRGASTLDGAVSGTGTINVGGLSVLATESTVANTEKIEFMANSGTLSIVDTAGFKAGIGGLVAGDKIDLHSTAFAFGGSETLAFKENAGNTAGTLTVTDGASTLKLALFGQFVASGFHLASDGNGGSAITYTSAAPASTLELAGGGHG